MLRLHLFSEVTTARGDVMTSWESLYLEAIWATDDDDDAWAPEASRPHEGGQEAKIKKKYLKASEVLTPSRWPVCGRSQSFVQTAITRTQAYLERPYLSPPQPLFPTVEPPAVTLTAAKQSMRKQFPPTRSGGCFLNHLKNWISNVTFRRVGQESRVHGVNILNERVSMITVGHYRSTDKTQKWRSHSDAQTYWDVSVPSALCFILLKTNVFCLCSHQIKCLAQMEDGHMFPLRYTLYKCPYNKCWLYVIKP